MSRSSTKVSRETIDGAMRLWGAIFNWVDPDTVYPDRWFVQARLWQHTGMFSYQTVYVFRTRRNGREVFDVYGRNVSTRAFMLTQKNLVCTCGSLQAAKVAAERVLFRALVEEKAGRLRQEE